MNATAETIASVLERYAACLRSADAGAVRLEHRIDQLRGYAAGDGRLHALTVRQILAELGENPAQYAPGELVELIVDLHRHDVDDVHTADTSGSAFSTLLDTLWGIALVERSSLGSPAAVRLRRRTTAPDLARVRAKRKALDARHSEDADVPEPADSALREAAAKIAALYERAKVFRELSHQVRGLTRTLSGTVRPSSLAPDRPGETQGDLASNPAIRPNRTRSLLVTYSRATVSSLSRSRDGDFFGELVIEGARVVALVVAYRAQAVPPSDLPELDIAAPVEHGLSSHMEIKGWDRLREMSEAGGPEHTDRPANLELWSRSNEPRTQATIWRRWPDAPRRRLDLTIAAYCADHDSDAVALAVPTWVAAAPDRGAENTSVVLYVPDTPPYPPGTIAHQIRQGAVDEAAARERSADGEVADDVPRLWLLLDEAEVHIEDGGLWTTRSSLRVTGAGASPSSLIPLAQGPDIDQGHVETISEARTQGRLGEVSDVRLFPPLYGAPTEGLRRPSASPFAEPTLALQPAQRLDSHKPNPLLAGTPEEFVATLRAWRVWSGNPSIRELARRCGGKPSGTTIARLLANSSQKHRSIKLEHVEAILAGTGAGTEEIQLWVATWRRIFTDASR